MECAGKALDKDSILEHARAQEKCLLVKDKAHLEFESALKPSRLKLLLQGTLLRYALGRAWMQPGAELLYVRRQEEKVESASQVEPMQGDMRGINLPACDAEPQRVVRQLQCEKGRGSER